VALLRGDIAVSLLLLLIMMMIMVIIIIKIRKNEIAPTRPITT
jgi:lipopolysaccharide/colanic/teichoic acid biosynthesis glycosyltransferase